MTSRLAVARLELAEALEPVLPGRVGPYQPTRLARPYVWLGVAELGLESTGGRTTFTSATFPVWIAYDGAQHAQVAGLDDLVAKVWDAVQTVPAARPIGSRNATTDIGGQLVTGHVVSVAYTLSAFTLCLPDVEESPIPPEPIHV